MSADLLLDRLVQLPREQLAVSAVRDTTAGHWRHWTRGELQQAVRRAAGSPGLPTRGEAWAWRAPRGGERLVRDLALQFAGVVGTYAGEGADLPPGTDDPGRLVRLRQDVRPRDAAVVRGRPMDHAEVAALAARVADRLGGGVVLCTAGTDAEQVLGWAAVWGGASLVVAHPEVRGVVDPAVWVARPEDLRGPRSPRGRLTHIYVDGPVPTDAAARFPGVTVGPWIA